MPSAPQKLEATAGDMSISLTWSSNAEIDLEKYIIYRSEISGFNPSESDSVGEIDFRESVYIDNKTDWGKDYYYNILLNEDRQFLTSLEHVQEAKALVY